MNQGREDKVLSGESREIIEDLLYQFAYDDSHGSIGTGGLSALEAAFDYVGWEDPHPLDKELLCNDAGCDRRATCGTPTDFGYKRLCYEHYAAISVMEVSRNMSNKPANKNIEAPKLGELNDG